MGTTVATGNAYGVVVGTGMNTELGRIASLSQQTVHEVSPLQKEMNHTATRVTQGTVILCSILLPVAIQTGLPFKDAFLYAIGIASSLIPQGLPAEINTSLAQAAKVHGERGQRIAGPALGQRAYRVPSRHERRRARGGEIEPRQDRGLGRNHGQRYRSRVVHARADSGGERAALDL